MLSAIVMRVGTCRAGSLPVTVFKLRKRELNKIISVSQRLFATKDTKSPTPSSSNKDEKEKTALQSSVLEQVLLDKPKKPTTFAGKAAEATTNTVLYTFVLSAVLVLGYFVYVLTAEFFADDSPIVIYTKALDLVRKDGRCLDLFGETIAGFGEETSRGRRRHVANHKYEKDGRQRIRVLFHVKGERDEGIAQAEMEKRDGNWEWRFLFVETKGRPKISHILIDNR